MSRWVSSRGRIGDQEPQAGRSSGCPLHDFVRRVLFWQEIAVFLLRSLESERRDGTQGHGSFARGTVWVFSTFSGDSPVGRLNPCGCRLLTLGPQNRVRFTG